MIQFRGFDFAARSRDKRSPQPMATTALTRTAAAP
jgi:hypothetical protein